MEGQIRVVKSTKGKVGLDLDGFGYIFDKNGDEKKIWRCEKYHPTLSLGCKARLHTTEDLESPQVIEKKGEHNHEPSPSSFDKKKFLENVRDQATSTDLATKTPSHILADALNEVPHCSQGSLPRLDNVKRTIRKVRNQCGGSLPAPHSVEDITLPDIYRKTLKGHPFLRHDSGPSSDRMLIFTTTDNLNFLKSSDLWFCDGTFKSSPVIFDQLLIIHGQRTQGSGVKYCLPLVYCLTPDRTTGTYLRVLQQLKIMQDGLAPPTIITDFEKALMNAFAQEFPNAAIQGCFFHFSQANYRNIQKYPAIHNLYSNNAEANLMIKKLTALSFIPPQDVVATFDELMEEDYFVQHEEELSDYTSYFERTWIGGYNPRRMRRMPPTYAIENWNCYHAILDGSPKTNNQCESFHRVLAGHLGASRPTIYKFIEALQDQQTITETKMQQFVAFVSAPPPRKKYRQHAEQLKQVVEKYNDNDMTSMEHLTRLAHHISLE